MLFQVLHSVRPATTADAEVIGRVVVRAWQAAYRGLVSDDYLDALDPTSRARQWRAAIADGSRTILVSEDNRAVVGFCSLAASQDDELRNVRTREITALYVDPAQWRQGHGRALVVAARAAADGARFERLALWVLESNQAARSFYAALGFAADGAERVDGHFRTELREVRYQLRVGGARLDFRPIDLDAHADICVRFRRDAYSCSFDDPGRFDAESGADGSQYLSWLRGRAAEMPAGVVHAWRGDRVVGQIEARIRRESRSGYVNLFYLVPEERGTGAGRALHDYVLALFRAEGIVRAELSVAPRNARAIRYYSKHGWRDVGPNPGNPDVRLMVLDV